MSISATEADELRARAELIVAERDRLANVVLDESRGLTTEEMQQLVLLNHTIDAMINAIRHQGASAESAPPAPMPPNRSVPGSDYRLVAASQLEITKDSYKLVMQLLADYGKWLVATISAAHLGGIYFLGSLDELTLKAKEPSLWALAIGLVLILTCGLATYYNWAANAAFYARRLRVDILVDPTAWPKDEPGHLSAIDLTQKIAIVLGIASAACILVAATLLSMAQLTTP